MFKSTIKKGFINESREDLLVRLRKQLLADALDEEEAKKAHQRLLYAQIAKQL